MGEKNMNEIFLLVDRSLDIEVSTESQRDALYRGFTRYCSNRIIYPPNHLPPPEKSGAMPSQSSGMQIVF